jgi:hypothetical protein
MGVGAEPSHPMFESNPASFFPSIFVPPTHEILFFIIHPKRELCMRLTPYINGIFGGNGSANC